MLIFALKLTLKRFLLKQIFPTRVTHLTDQSASEAMRHLLFKYIRLGLVIISIHR